MRKDCIHCRNQLWAKGVSALPLEILKRLTRKPSPLSDWDFDENWYIY
jgi:hypothetical protein